MNKPVIFVIGDDLQSLSMVESELRKRYEADYQVIGERLPAAALEKLEGLKQAGAEVAILLAGCRALRHDRRRTAHRLAPGLRPSRPVGVYPNQPGFIRRGKTS